MNQAETLTGAGPVSDDLVEGTTSMVALTTFAAPGLADQLATALSPDGVAPMVAVEHEDLLDEVLDDLPSVEQPPGLLWCWARLEDLWRGLPLPMTDPPQDYRDAAIELADAVLELSRRWECPLLFVLPAVPVARPLGAGDADTPLGMVAIATAVREALRGRLAGHRGVHVIDVEEDVRLLGLARSMAASDTGSPYSAELYQSLARRTARLAELLRAPRVRAVVVEADGPLWNDRDVQQRLLELRRLGVLLAVCADVNGAELGDALARQELPIRRHHIAAVLPGPVSTDLIAELAAEMDVLPEEVTVLRASAPPGSPVLPDRLPPDAQDRRRLGHDWGHTVPSDRPPPEERLAELGIKVRFLPVTAETTADALLTAGHAFELNRWSAGRAELAVLAFQTDHLVRLVQLGDLDGDHGVVGLSVVRLADSDAELIAFRLLHRAAGRGVERAMLADLLAHSAERGATRVLVTPTELTTHGPAARFFHALGASGPHPHPLPPVEWPSWISLEQPDD